MHSMAILCFHLTAAEQRCIEFDALKLFAEVVGPALAEHVEDVVAALRGADADDPTGRTTGNGFDDKPRLAMRRGASDAGAQEQAHATCRRKSVLPLLLLQAKAHFACLLSRSSS